MKDDGDAVWGCYTQGVWRGEVCRGTGECALASMWLGEVAMQKQTCQEGSVMGESTDLGDQQTSVSVFLSHCVV